MTQSDLFATENTAFALDPGATFLGGFAKDEAPALLAHVQAIAAQAPFRHMTTPGGRRMSVATTSCGRFGWTSSPRGYRYAPEDPESGRPWPEMPEAFLHLARRAAARAGYADFRPDSCLVNRYAPGARLSLHQDRDERDMSAPIVSVSLGLSAIFLWGGTERGAPRRRLALHEGDVVVWGGPSRLVFHGVEPVEGTGFRTNLTFRKVT